MSALFRRLFSIGFTGFLFAAAIASAQETWTSVPAPTTENLWGICYGGGQFVAVGGGGTILTSPDGTAWTARVSGTKEWLLGVCYGDGVNVGEGLFVAVGDHGTILTSPDAITWTDHSIGGPRLNAVGRYGYWTVAVGEAGTVVTADRFAANWTANNGFIPSVPGHYLRALSVDSYSALYAGQGGVWVDARFIHVFIPVPSGTLTTQNIESVARDSTTGMTVFVGGGGFMSGGLASDIPHGAPADSYFRGVVIFNHSIVAVGEKGLICASPGTLSFFVHPVASDTSANLNAVAASADIAVAVGDAGHITRSLAQTYSPTVARAPYADRPVFYPKGQAYLTSAFGSSLPLNYQWSFTDATGATQVLSGKTDSWLSLSDLTLVQAGRYTVTASNALGSASASVDLPVAYAPPSGQVDSLFVPSMNVGRVDLVAVLPDGRIVLAGPDNPSVRTSPNYRVQILRPDGSRDSTFSPSGVGVRTLGGIARLIPQSDGKIIVLGDFTEIGSVAVAGVARLNVDGSVDSSFATSGLLSTAVPLADGRFIDAMLGYNTITLSRFTVAGAPDPSYPVTTVTLPPANDFLAPGSTYSTVDSASLSNGQRILSVGNYRTQLGTAAAGADESVLLRLQSDGLLDSSYAIAHVNVHLRQIVGVGTKLYYGTYETSADLGSRRLRTFGRLNADGSPDATYPTREFSWSAFSWAPGSTPIPAALAADGSVLALQARSIVRYDPAGKRDADYSAQLDLVPTASTRLTPLADGSVLVSGEFSAINGLTRPGLARVIPIAGAYTTRLANLSLRTAAGPDSDILIAGFVLAGTGGNRNVLVRGIGPGLIPYDVPAAEALADPQLILYRQTTTILSNDDWDSALSPAANAVGAFPLPAGSKDSALLASLTPDAYSAHVTGHDGTSGTALAEVYDTDSAPTTAIAPRLINVSGRSMLRNRNDVLIAGFVIAGPITKRILIRAVGPSLKDHGVNTPLADPHLTIYKAQQALAQNDDWQINDAPAFDEVGAFQLTVGSKDAALVIDLPPGAYTAVASSGDGTPGVVLVEIYEVP